MNSSFFYLDDLDALREKTCGLADMSKEIGEVMFIRGNLGQNFLFTAAKSKPSSPPSNGGRDRGEVEGETTQSVSSERSDFQ